MMGIFLFGCFILFTVGVRNASWRTKSQIYKKVSNNGQHHHCMYFYTQNSFTIDKTATRNGDSEAIIYIINN